VYEDSGERLTTQSSINPVHLALLRTGDVLIIQ
jgi:hypothetical protein